MPYVKAKDDVDIYYEATGQGTRFLFLSETACDGAVWNLYQTPEFSRDHRVVTLDYRAPVGPASHRANTPPTSSPKTTRWYSIISVSMARQHVAEVKLHAAKVAHAHLEIAKSNRV